VKDALARITRAQAADTLREAIAQAAPEAARRRRDETLTKAVEDLTPAFDRMIADLTVAAQKLDPENPVDIGNAIRDEHERQLLHETCRTRDLCERLQAVLDSDGVMSQSSQGVRVHPARWSCGNSASPSRG